MLKYYYSIIGLFLSGVYSFINAQTGVRDFSLQQVEQSVKISFVIVSRQYCTGYDIQRSQDTTDFSTIYHYPVVCSESMEPVKVVYYDNQPIKNSVAYYRVLVSPSGYSSILSITYFESAETGYILYSNPTDGFFKLKINSAFATVELFNLMGHKTAFYTADAKGMINENIETLPDGIYYFLIKTTNNFLIRGKVIKAQ